MHCINMSGLVGRVRDIEPGGLVYSVDQISFTSDGHDPEYASLVNTATTAVE